MAMGIHGDARRCLPEIDGGKVAARIESDPVLHRYRLAF
jgi:hypothetical protein